MRGNPVSDGTYVIGFSFYEAETGGDAVWTETQSVSVSNGIFYVHLGIVSPFNLTFDAPYWLGVEVSGDTEMRPRQRLTSAGYAMNAESLDTYTSNQFIRSDTNDTIEGQLTLTYPGTAFVVQPSSALETNKKLFAINNTSGDSTLYIDYEGDLSSHNANITGTLDVTGAAGLSDSLEVTGNTLLRGTTSMEDSLTVGSNLLTVDTNTGCIGIGTAVPGKVLHVVGDTDILGDFAVGTEANPKDIIVRGDLNVTGNQVVSGSTNYTGDLVVGSDGAGKNFTAYSDIEGNYLVWDDETATMSITGTATFDEVRLADNKKIKLGNGQDVEMYVDDEDLLDITNITPNKDIYFQVNCEGVTTTPFAIDSTNARISIGDSGQSTIVDVIGDIRLQGRIRQGALGDFAEMMPISCEILKPSSILLVKVPDILSLCKGTLENNNKKYNKELLKKPEPADVVIIDKDGGLRRSFEPFSKNVAGIISSNPAQVLRDDLQDGVPLALSGGVPCNVVNENGPIHPGDLLVSSSVPRYAMNAGESPQVGTVIGKALGELSGGK